VATVVVLAHEYFNWVGGHETWVGGPVPVEAFSPNVDHGLNNYKEEPSSG